MENQYEVWQKKGTFGATGYYEGRQYEEERLGIFLQIAMGLESLPNPALYREKYYLFYVCDDGGVGHIVTRQGYLKPINPYDKQ